MNRVPPQMQPSYSVPGMVLGTLSRSQNCLLALEVRQQ